MRGDLVGAPLVGALGGHKGRPHAISKNCRFLAAFKIVAPEALWSAAACCRFCPASLLASSLLQHPALGQQVGLEESGGKLPHS